MTAKERRDAVARRWVRRSSTLKQATNDKVLASASGNVGASAGPDIDHSPGRSRPGHMLGLSRRAQRPSDCASSGSFDFRFLALTVPVVLAGLPGFPAELPEGRAPTFR